MLNIKVNDIECEMCVSRISKALSEEKIDAEISLADKTVTIANDNDLEKAKETIEALGFTPGE